MTENSEHRQQLYPPRSYEGYLYRCGRIVLDRSPRMNKQDRCPGGLFVCEDCVDDLCEFLKEAYNARAVDKEWEVEDFDPLPK